MDFIENKTNEIYKDFFSRILMISAIDRNKVSQKLWETYDINFNKNEKLPQTKLKLEKTLKSIKNRIQNPIQNNKKREVKSYQKMIESVISMNNIDELNNLKSYNDITDNNLQSISNELVSNPVTSYEDIKSMFEDEKVEGELPSFNSLKEYIISNSNKKKSKQSSMLSVDTTIGQVKSWLKKLHKYWHLNLLEIRKDFSSDSAFLQVLMILLNKLKVIELYKQKKANVSLFGEQTESDEWYYWVRLKNTKPINFEKES